MNSFVVSNGGYMVNFLNKKKTHHFKLPVHSKNFFTMPFVAQKLNKIIAEKNINIVHVRSRAPAWLLKFVSNKKFKSVTTFHNIYESKNFLKKYYNKALSEVDYVVAISEYVKSKIIDMYNINANKIRLKIGNYLVAEGGKVAKDYKEKDVKEYMKWNSINIEINLNIGNASYTVYTCDFTHDYIDINANYKN